MFPKNITIKYHIMFRYSFLKVAIVLIVTKNLMLNVICLLICLFTIFMVQASVM